MAGQDESETESDESSESDNDGNDDNDGEDGSQSNRRPDESVSNDDAYGNSLW